MCVGTLLGLKVAALVLTIVVRLAQLSNELN